MSYDEDHIALAAEYALGTLDAEERELVETMMIVDHGFTSLVDAWELKLAPLHEMVGDVEPPDHVWHNIVAATGIAPQESIVLPEYRSQARDGYAAQADTRFVADGGRSEFAADSERSADAGANVVKLQERRKRGGAFGVVMTALAASLAGIIALQAYKPDLLPSALRVKPLTQTVEVKVPSGPAPAQMVALLQQNGSGPAFVMTVDTASKTFTVRKLGAAAEAGKNYELWLVSDKLQKPRSLGVIGNSDFTIRPTLASYDNDTITKATYAVTVEPEGGSPTGGPTGAVVFKGNLIESVPAGADSIAPR